MCCGLLDLVRTRAVSLSRLVDALTRAPADAASKAAEFFAAGDARPFFLVFAFHDPHRAPGGFANNANDSPAKIDPAKVHVPDFLPDTPQVRADLADYY
ncbi:MAG: hypothetical protein ABR611_16555, partial [Chthoniobacterales bacterium]